VGSCAALAERERAERGTGGHPLERLAGARAAAGRDRRSGNGVHQEHHPSERACRAHGLAGMGERGQRPTGTAVLGRDDEPERPELAEGAHVLLREGSLAIDATCLPCDASLSGLTNRVEQDLDVVAHGRNPFGR
jgi:hypothetical protein